MPRERTSLTAIVIEQIYNKSIQGVLFHEAQLQINDLYCLYA